MEIDLKKMNDAYDETKNFFMENPRTKPEEFVKYFI